MATWYAQKGSCNINSVSGGTTSDVWNSAANGSGSWMDTSVLTAGGNTVLAANGQTAIDINIDINLGTGRLSTAAEGGTAGGGFTVSGARTITADILAGTTPGLVTSNTDYTVTVVGDITGGTASYSYGMQLAAGVSATITGDVSSGSGTGSRGISTAGAGTIAITGDLIGAKSYGVYGGGSVVITVNGSIRATDTSPVVGQTGLVTVNNGNIIGYNNIWPIWAALVFNPGAGNYVEIAKTTGGAGTFKYGKTIPAADVQSGVDGDGANAPATGTFTAPAVGDVVDGVKYGGAGTEYEGTFVVPAEADVKDGVGYGEDGTEYEGSYAGGGGGGGSVIGSSVIRRAA